MGKGSTQGADFLLGSDAAAVAHDWAVAIEQLCEEIRADFWVIPPRRTGTSSQVRAAFVIFALASLRQHAELVRAHLREKGDLREAIGLFDEMLPNLRQMRDILDHLDEYMIGRGKLQRKASEPPTENDIGPVVALQGPGPDQREANNLEDYAIVMISSLGVWQIDLRTATRCSQMLFVGVHRVHHDCSRCYEPGDRCTICQPLSDAEIKERFGDLDSSPDSA